jgi:UDP-hydrolysing UDP-N-acetyl-D-glucosamine 2-epimerase
VVKIAVVVTARPSYAKWKTTLEALRDMPDVELQVIVAASANLERYGAVRGVIEADGFPIAAECWTVLEGENLLTGARETGLALMDLASIYHRLQPDIVCVMADRREILAAAAAAKYQHLKVAHVQGGESSGTIDGVVRHAVSHLADVHFPCTNPAKWRIYGLTGSFDIHNFGCGSVDLAKRAQSEPLVTEDELGGAGAILNLAKPFVICLQHPVTDEADQSHAQMWETLHALPHGLQCVCLWPGQDAGSAGISKAIREYQETYGTLHTVRNLPPSRFLRLLTQCACLIGNSSAGIRESAFLGVPVVDIGNRQRGRQRAKNVTWVPHEQSAIRQAIARQMAHGKYPSSHLYGSGNAGQQIAEVLRNVANDLARTSKSA